MAKSLKDLDLEFQARRHELPADQPEVSPQPLSGRLEALDRAFREQTAKKRELEERQAAAQPRLLWRQESKQAGDKPFQTPSEDRETAGPEQESQPSPSTQIESDQVELPPQTEEEQRVKHRRYVVSIFSNILFYVAMLTMVLAALAFAQNSEGMGNTRLYNVLTTSMQSVYPKGSLVVVRATDPKTLVVGNDITFYLDANTTVTHRIVSITEDYEGSGERAFETKGVDNPTSDYSLVRESAVVGKVVFFLPMVGAFLATFRERLWIIVLFFLSVVGFSFFLNLTFGETWQERKERRARKILESASRKRREENEDSQHRENTLHEPLPGSKV